MHQLEKLKNTGSLKNGEHVTIRIIQNSLGVVLLGRLNLNCLKETIHKVLMSVGSGYNV